MERKGGRRSEIWQRIKVWTHPGPLSAGGRLAGLLQFPHRFTFQTCLTARSPGSPPYCGLCPPSDHPSRPASTINPRLTRCCIREKFLLFLFPNGTMGWLQIVPQSPSPRTNGKWITRARDQAYPEEARNFHGHHGEKTRLATAASRIQMPILPSQIDDGDCPAT